MELRDFAADSDYRVVEREGKLYFHEAYYSRSGELVGISDDEVRINAVTIMDVKRYVVGLFLALNKPVLKYEDISKFSEARQTNSWVDMLPRFDTRKKK
jgi:hypothetical protein